MKVVSVKIHNILGIEDFEIKPKEINRFEGKNASGKTSTLEAIKSALRGGHDATLLRNGSDEGQVVILLDDGLEIKKTVTADKTDLSVKYPRSGIRVDKPQTHLNALIDALSINPVEFLTAPAGKRAEYLLQAMPLKVTMTDLKDIYPYSPDPKEHAFTVLAAVDKLIYDERTGVNRLKDEKRKTAKQLGETLPLEEGEAIDWTAQVKTMTTSLADTKNDLKSVKEAADRKNKDYRVGIDGACLSAISAANAIFSNEERESEKVGQKEMDDMKRISEEHGDEYRRKLAEIEEWNRAQIKKIADEFSEKVNTRQKDILAKSQTRDAAILNAKDIEKAAINEEESRYKSELDSATSDLSAKITKLSSDLSAAEVNAKQQIKENATRATIERVNIEADKHEADALVLTDKLEKLQELRLHILANLPIPGVTVVDGQVMKDGVVYDRLNTASQIDIAVAIAKIRAKELGIVCVDGLECLDDENFKAFEAAMQGSGLQCFITRVTNNPMEVTTK